VALYAENAAKFEVKLGGQSRILQTLSDEEQEEWAARYLQTVLRAYQVREKFMTVIALAKLVNEQRGTLEKQQAAVLRVQTAFRRVRALKAFRLLVEAAKAAKATA
jgi:hypothetical protein